MKRKSAKIRQFFNNGFRIESFKNRYEKISQNYTNSIKTSNKYLFFIRFLSVKFFSVFLFGSVGTYKIITPSIFLSNPINKNHYSRKHFRNVFSQPKKIGKFPRNLPFKRLCDYLEIHVIRAENTPWFHLVFCHH